jgi:predicted DNA-binding protein
MFDRAQARRHAIGKSPLRSPRRAQRVEAQRRAAKRPRLSSGPLEPLVRLDRRASVDAPAAPRYSSAVSIDLPGSVEEQLRALAAKQGRDVRVLVEEAIRLYIEGSAITDVDANALAETQTALLGELPQIPDWKAGGA